MSDSTVDFRDYSAEQRQQMADKGEAMEDGSFPIKTGADLKNAVKAYGRAKDKAKAKAHIEKRAKEMNLESALPDKWNDGDADDTADMSHAPVPAPADERVSVDFALASARYEANGYAVYPNSLLFRAGEYQDKGFTATPEDIKRMAATWKPGGIRGNIEHKQFLRGRAGVITEAWPEEDGQVLRGVVKVPLALDALLTDQERKVSLEIHRERKTAEDFALTADPRVPDALLMSIDALSNAEDVITFGKRHDTNQGQYALQNLHDMTTRYGATCKANMASVHENKAIQAMHDLAVAHGAKCDSRDHSTAGANPYFSTDSTLPTSDSKPNPSSANTARPQRAKGAKPMSIKDTLKALFGKAGVPENEIDQQLESVEFAAASGDDARIVDMAKTIAQMTQDKRRTDAEIWVEGEVRAGRALPAERDCMIAAFMRACEDDAVSPATVTFSTEGQQHNASRVEALRALYALRQPHELLQELMKDSTKLKDTVAMFNQMETKREGDARVGTMSPERRRELLSKTSDGMAILRNEDRKAAGK